MTKEIAQQRKEGERNGGKTLLYNEEVRLKERPKKRQTLKGGQVLG